MAPLRTEAETLADDYPVIDNAAFDHEYNHIPFGLIVPECAFCAAGLDTDTDYGATASTTYYDHPDDGSCTSCATD